MAGRPPQGGGASGGSVTAAPGVPAPPNTAAAASAAAGSAGSQNVAAPTPPAALRVKLSYKERRELDALPERIAALETEQSTLQSALADPSLWQRPPDEIRALQERHGAIETELFECLERWELLEAKAG